MGNRMVKILDIEDHSIHNRHPDQVKINEVDNSEIRPDDTDENNITESVRTSQRLASKPRHHFNTQRDIRHAADASIDSIYLSIV
ncbi:unnamed protein product [Trichobilharzia regenti]|nr:unnamed protein product [Trichobilharzia regenti]